jgi:hypothetical protein
MIVHLIPLLIGNAEVKRVPVFAKNILVEVNSALTIVRKVLGVVALAEVTIYPSVAATPVYALPFHSELMEPPLNSSIEAEDGIALCPACAGVVLLSSNR